GATTTYTLTATNSAGSVTATTKVRVNETKIIQPGSEGKDARVDEYFNDKNYGGQEFLYIGKTVVVFPGLMRAYLQFDLSAIPANAEVIEAKLKLYQYDYFVSGSFSIGVYRVLDNWAESTITWDNQPDSDLTNFGSITISSSTVGKWREWNIRNWVQGWLDGSFENNGILLKATSETTIEARGYFYSSDYTDDTTKRPKLEIKYYIP
ncbi:MAG: DNRLRE domain-containing protein, partial [Atribacterota bacterium]